MKYSQEDYENKVYERFGNEYEVIGEYTGIYNRIEVKHIKCGQTYTPVARDLMTGRGCSHCYSRKRLSESKAFKEIIDVLGDDYRILDSYKNSVTPLKIKHLSCGTVYKASHNNIKKSKCKCPKCKQKSKGESIIKHFLESNNIKYIEQKRFSDCKYKNTLPFDFYLPEFNVLIEFQGKQHYVPRKQFGGEDAFRELKRRDRIKYQYALENGYTFIEIKYSDIQNISNILINKLEINI